MKVINRDDPLVVATFLQFETSSKFEALFNDGSEYSTDRRDWLPLGGMWPDGQIDDGDVRAHPNGFIQLDLDNEDRRRLHVWHDKLPKQQVSTPIHDHRFDFVSTILIGKLTNVVYEIEESSAPSHRRWKAVRDTNSQETHLEPFAPAVLAKMAYALSLDRGKSYSFLAGRFHETQFQTPTVTLMTKQHTYFDHESSALVPIGVEPDNTFSRHSCSKEYMWTIIEEALSSSVPDLR